LPIYERALKLREKTKLGPDWLAVARFNVGQTMWRLGRDRARARALAVQGRDELAALAMPVRAVSLALMNDWLRENR
jgi:hypothetical protein